MDLQEHWRGMAAFLLHMQDPLQGMKTGEAHLRDALREIAYHGTSRPLSYGSGDDGDGWYRRIALRMISAAALALKEYELGQQLMELYSPEDAEKWLASPHPMLDGEIPNDLIEDGRLDNVMRLVAQLRDCEDLDDFPGRS